MTGLSSRALRIGGPGCEADASESGPEGITVSTPDPALHTLGDVLEAPDTADETVEIAAGDAPPAAE
jgi:hypothetical protein